LIEFREAREDELETWDDLTVRPAGGHVLQSRAWAEYRQQAGWHPRFLMGADGSAVLALLKPWPRVAGWSAYLSRGPVPTTADPHALAARLDGATRYLTGQGVDVVASDPQVPASTGYAAELERIGFKPIEEIQPSRHRLSVPLGPDIDEEQALARVSKQTRQRIRKAESELQIVRWDKTVLRGDVGEGFAKPEGDLDWALAKFHVMLIETARRRQFEILPRKRFNDWAYLSYTARQSLYLEAIDKRGAPMAGLLIYRHGDRLSTFLSADFDNTRDAHPGAFHLLRWRAIQLAIREGCAEMDLDGADLVGARRIPEPSDRSYGLYQHKKSFGAEWVELTGAHERVARPTRYLVGRTIAALERRYRPNRAK
jgi:lipid II:glycine glycyltransferase (peptidoglycan interpeptide bridge formation enzyme)